MPTLTLTYYDPNASRMRADTLDDFLRAPLTGELQQVPGIGKDTEGKLKARGVSTTHQLLGVYLQGGDCNTFFRWLQAAGVHAHRNTVVRCISEKAAQMFGGPPPPALPVLDELVEGAEAEVDTSEEQSGAVAAQDVEPDQAAAAAAARHKAERNKKKRERRKRAKK